MNYRAAKNSGHIRQSIKSKLVGRPPLTSADILAFSTGYDAIDHAGPLQIAWLLENEALDRGWPVDESLGSAADFIEQFASSRDVVSGAIRIVEARGLMRMRRGCKGGLRLLMPDAGHAAGSFATYLRASGYSIAQLDIANATAEPLFAEFSRGAVVWELWTQISELLTTSAPVDGRVTRFVDGARAEFIAMQLLGQFGTSIPESGAVLGCEADICEEHGLDHRTFRQTLWISTIWGCCKLNAAGEGDTFLNDPLRSA